MLDDSARLKSMALLFRTFVAASIQEDLDIIYCGQRYVHMPLLGRMPSAAVLLKLSLYPTIFHRSYCSMTFCMSSLLVFASNMTCQFFGLILSLLTNLA